MKVGIVGYGLAGRYFHAPTLTSAGFEVSTICARSIQRKADAHADFPNAVLVNSIEELLDEDLDLVVIASTNEVHAQHALQAINAGVPTVVDKPMGLNYQQSSEIFDAADSASVPITVFFNRLWDSDALTLKHAVTVGAIGKPFRLDSRYERFRPDINPNSWREQNSSQDGGGLLLDLQSHLVSTALDWFGDGDLVYSAVRSVRGAADDDVVLVLKHHSGVDSYLSTSSIVGAPGPRIRLNGDQGTLVVTDLDHQESFMRKGLIPKPGEWIASNDISSEARIWKGDSSYNFPGVAGNYPQFYRLVRQALETGSAMPISKDFALRVAEIIDQARAMSVRD
ncbi:MAG: dehydrogenase [Candidatus Nanopelagicaceae bacterium]|nr:dehydrogenase [Candidatus Nanopelagicaceae bacterium]